MKVIRISDGKKEIAIPLEQWNQMTDDAVECVLDKYSVIETFDLKDDGGLQ